MKRRLTLAIGCLACAMPSIASTLSPQTARSSAAPSHLSQSSDLSDQSDQSVQPSNSSSVIRHSAVSEPVQNLHNLPTSPVLTLPSAAQLAQHELDTRGLSPAHAIASIVFLKGSDPATGHYDIRIEPPAALPGGTRLRGFSIALDGTILPATDFRAATAAASGTGAPLSTQPSPGHLPEWGLRTGDQAG
jgi:hypothetical protein